MRTIVTLLFLAVSAASALAQARIINTTATRPVTEAPAISAYRANALTFRVKLDATRPTLTGVTTLTAEIRASKLDTDAPLAATDVDAPTGAGPFDIEMTAGQMNQSLGGAASGVFWLVIYTIAPGDVLDVLYTAPLKLMEHGASLTAPAPPNTAIALTRSAADALYTTLAATAALDVRVTDLEAGTGTDTVLGDSDGVGVSDSSDLWVSDGTPAGAVDLTPYALTASVAAGYQPLDSELTSLAALASTTFGRGLITTMDAAGLRTTAGLGTLATQSGTFSGSSSNTNTGDQDLSPYALTASLGTLASQSGTFSGTSSGTNTGDQDLSGYLPTASAATTYVPVTRTINGSALSSNVTISTITGNAGTATALATPRAINGTNFDGSAAITVTAAADTLTGATLNATVTGSSLTSVGVLAGLTSSAAIEARNGATAVPVYAYNTYTSGTSYERGSMTWASNILKIGTEKGSGGGTARALALMTDATSRWTIGATNGHINAGVDNTYDIGSSGTLRPRNVYAGGKVYVPGVFFGSDKVELTATVTGTLLALDAAGTGFNRFQFGGTTSSYPALKRVGAEFQVVLASTTAATNVAAADADMGFIEDRYRRKGTGTPEAAVTAPIGAIFHRTDGGASTSFYVKESGTGNTGWVAK